MIFHFFLEIITSRMNICPFIFQYSYKVRLSIVEDAIMVVNLDVAVVAMDYDPIIVKIFMIAYSYSNSFSCQGCFHPILLKIS